MTMTQDLLSREAVDRRLVNNAIERTGGRPLVGLRFDSKTKAWYVLLKGGAEMLARLSSEVLSSTSRGQSAKHRAARRRKQK